MKLTDLDPRWAEHPAGNRYMTFVCPTCPEDVGHKLTLPVGNTHFPEQTWTLESEPDFAVLTISPSIQQNCKTRPHYFIRGGQLQIV